LHEYADGQGRLFNPYPDIFNHRLALTREGPSFKCTVMDAKRGSITRHFGDLHPEFVPLGLLVEESIHGYELYRRFGQTLAGLWRISESQMYATLKRLEDRGLVEGEQPEKGSAASRRVLSPSAEGRKVFETWLFEPSVCYPKVLRLEFLTRLFFAKRLLPDSVAALFIVQRALVAKALERSVANRAVPVEGFDVLDLALAFSEGQLRSALEWMDESVGPGIAGMKVAVLRKGLN
jgi:PadR family transcriptional regulator, regulatory protein AphA